MKSLRILLSVSELHKDLGLLIVRLGIGLSIALFHGFGKIKSDSEVWERLGRNMQNLGVDFVPVFWGFMAAFSEFFGSILIVLGIFFRPSTLLLAFTMLVAAIRHLSLPAEAARSGWSGASHALELLVIYVALFIMGPGKYRIPSKW